MSLRSIGRAIVTFAIAGLIMVTSFRRSRLGVSGPMGESMFVDLRDRISKQGNLPPLPHEWLVESVVKSAGGTSFAGDFLVARRSSDDKFELVVVDVSGKGVEAGSRSLFLSGAFNGIVSALPGGRFLPAANDYLMGQGWGEGFATAIHLHLDLQTGAFELRKAGHPPAMWLHAGSGRWSVLNSDGPALGLIEDADFECIGGQLSPGDGLLLFTDGLVETADRDISLGMDKLAGLGERLVQGGFDGGAKLLIDSMEQTNDDRALVVVHRRSTGSKAVANRS
ncbi:MAG: PP2C family protein-serine/threonine phosphatase [Marmoricola sp.]